MIITDEMPFSVVEKEGFKRVLNAMQPRFNLVSRTTITKDCINIYETERKKLRFIFESSASCVCLTTDLWTSIQNLGYICLTAHYIDKEWILQKRIINFRVLPTPHRGEIIAQSVETCLLGWGIDKVNTLTVDNASSNDVAATSLKKRLVKRNGLLLDGSMLHVRCFGHVLNLIVKDGIDEVNSAIVRIRDGVKYVRSSLSRYQLFRKCVDIEKIPYKKSLCLDVPTRWNSTFYMLDTALEYQKAFDRLEEQDRSFTLELKNGTPTDDDWLAAKNLHKFLEQFYLVTKRVSGSQYVTANIYFHEMMRIHLLLHKSLSSDNIFFREMSRKMMLKFKKYCDRDKINPLLLIAVVLDPCYKLTFLRYKLSKVYTRDEVDELIEKVKVTLDKLYEHYSSVELASLKNVDASKEGINVGTDISDDPNVVLDDDVVDWGKFLEIEQTKVLKSELERYLDDAVEFGNESRQTFNILKWWKEKASSYRVLSRMARDIFAIPISTVASESAFSTGGRVLDPFRSSLTPKIVESLICTQDWLKSYSSTIKMEEKLEDMEEMDKGMFVTYCHFLFI